MAPGGSLPSPAPNTCTLPSSSPSHILRGKKHLKVDLPGVQSTCPFLIFQCSRGTRNTCVKYDVGVPCLLLPPLFFFFAFESLGLWEVCSSRSPVRTIGGHLSTVAPTTSFFLSFTEEAKQWSAF